MSMSRFATSLALLVSVVCPLTGQNPTAPVMPATTQPLPPAAKLEGFRPSAGAALILGYTTIGNTRGVSVDARQVRSGVSNEARGILVHVASGYRDERSFVDVDEIAELLRGIDALLGVSGNPTDLDQFEVRYTTKGDLEVTAFSHESLFDSKKQTIDYTVSAGRLLQATASLDKAGMVKFKSLVEQAQAKLAALSAK